MKSTLTAKPLLHSFIRSLITCLLLFIFLASPQAQCSPNIYAQNNKANSRRHSAKKQKFVANTTQTISFLNQLQYSGNAIPTGFANEVGLGDYPLEYDRLTGTGGFSGTISLAGYTNVTLHLFLNISPFISGVDERVDWNMHFEVNGQPVINADVTQPPQFDNNFFAYTYSDPTNPGCYNGTCYVTNINTYPINIPLSGNSFTINCTNTGQANFVYHEYALQSKANWYWKMYLTADLCSPTAGTIATNITAGDPGSTVTLMGNGWQTGTGNHYQITLDGVPVTSAVQAPASCSDQPNITFDIPCQTPPGLHQLACQLLDSANQPVLASVPQVDFTVTAPPIAPLATACQVGVTIDFKGTGIPLSQGNPPGNTPAYINSVVMKGTLSPGTPAGGTYKWTTSSNKISLSGNINSDTITVTAVSESSAPLDVPIKLTYTLSNGVFYSETLTTTVQKPTYMGFVRIVAGSNRQNSCKGKTAGWHKIIVWQVQDKWHNISRYGKEK